jgi:hypothetical protein
MSFDINNQMFSGMYPPGFQQFQMGNPMLQAQRQAAFQMLNPQFGAFRQPFGMAGPATMQTQLYQFMGGFGPMGSALAPMAQGLAQNIMGTSLANLPPFGSTYDPGRFMIGGMGSRPAMPFRPTIDLNTQFQSNDPTTAMQQIQDRAKQDRLFRSINSITSGFSKFQQDGDAGQILAGRSAADITNFLRGNGPLARMAAGLLESVGVEDELSVVPGVTNTTNQFLGRARFNKNFGRDISTGLIDRVNDISSPLADVGFRGSGEALQQLASRNMLNVGNMNLHGSVNRGQLDELKKRAVDQVEEIAEILKAGKEIGLSVDQTLTAFQAFTGGDLKGRLDRAGDKAVRNFGKTPFAGTIDEAVKEARQQTAAVTARQFREAQISAELAGSDLPTLLAVASAGAGQLQQMGISGTQSALLGEVTALSSQAQGTGVTQAQIAQMAAGRVGTFVRTREGRAAAVLKHAVSTGMVDPSQHPEIAALVKQFETTGKIDAGAVNSALSGAGLGKDTITSLFSSQGVQHALSNPEVSQSLTEAMTFDERYNFTGTMKRAVSRRMRSGVGKGVASDLAAAGVSQSQLQDLVIKGIASGNLAETLRKFGTDNGLDIDQLQQFGAIMENEANRRAAVDPRVINAEATLKREDPERAKAAKEAASTQLAFQDVVTNLARQTQTREALKAMGMDEDLANDADALGTALEDRDEKAEALKEKAKKLRAQGRIEEAKKVEAEELEMRTGSQRLRDIQTNVPMDRQNLLERFGDVMATLGAAGGNKDLEDMASLQNIMGQMFGGMDRHEVAKLVVGELGVVKDGKVVGLNKAKLKEYGLDGENVNEDLLLDFLQGFEDDLTKTVQTAEEEKEGKKDPKEKIEEEDKEKQGQENIGEKIKEVFEQMMTELRETLEGVINVNVASSDVEFFDDPVPEDGGQ